MIIKNSEGKEKSIPKRYEDLECLKQLSFEKKRLSQHDRLMCEWDLYKKRINQT